MTASVRAIASSSNVLAAPENLWERAAASLREKDKVLIVSNATVNLKDILCTIDAEKKSCESNRLVVKRGPDKDPIILRDIFSKIAGWIEKFVAVGDTAVQYDPGHAALPWAAVRLILQISVQDVRRYAAVLQGIENVSKIITRCTILELLYFPKEMRATDQTKNAMVELYATILSFFAKARRYLAKGTLRKTVGSIIDFDNKFQSILTTIGEEETEIQRYTTLMDAEYQKDSFATMTFEQRRYDEHLRTSLSEMQRPIDRIEKRLQSYEDGLQAAERIQILEWLSPIPYMQHHVQASSDVLLGTGQWLLDHDDFLQWQNSESSAILWLHGIPGSGKSKLVSILIEDLLAGFKEGDGSCPIFFYCTRNPAERERASPEAILRSLARQMSCPDAGQAIEGLTREVYNGRKQNAFAAGPLSLEESVSMIIELSGLRPRTTIVIDALDECNRQEREYLLDGLSKIVKDSISSVKIFASSREETEIAYHLDGCHNVQIAAKQNQKDIDAFVNSEVDKQIQKKRLLHGKVSETLRQRIKQVLCEQAQGMSVFERIQSEAKQSRGKDLLTSFIRFRWVSLQLQYLCTIKVAGLVEKRLGSLPQDLRRIYEETYIERFREYQDEEKALVQSAFRWLLCSYVPLDTETFLTLTSSSSYQKAIDGLSRDALLDLCFNFIVHDAELDVFRFAHLSVREYLESVDRYRRDKSHAFAAEYCLRLLTFELSIRPSRDSHLNARKDDKSHGGANIIRYTHICWGPHLKKSDQHRFTEPLRTLFSKFTMDEHVVSLYFSCWNGRVSSFKNWGPYHGMRSLLKGVLSNPVDLIFTASSWDFEELMQRRIAENSQNLNVRNGRGMTALHIACGRASLKVARLLIEQGVDLEATHSFSGGQRTALMDAVSHGHADLVQILLESHANLCTTNCYGETALKFAIEQGSTAMTKLLIRFGADVTEMGQTSTLFSHAAYYGHVGVVEILCERTGVDEASQKRWLARTEMMRVIRDSGDMTKLFRRAESNEIMDQATLRAGLFASIECGNVNAGNTLIAMGADVKSKTPYPEWWTQPFDASGPSILCDAIIHLRGNMHQTSFVELLLDSGALVDPYPSRSSNSPLKTAVKSGNEAVVNMLLERGVRLDGVNYELLGSDKQGSILDFADHKGQVAISQLLRKHGCVSAISNSRFSLSVG